MPLSHKCRSVLRPSLRRRCQRQEKLDSSSTIIERGQSDRMTLVIQGEQKQWEQEGWITGHCKRSEAATSHVTPVPVKRCECDVVRSLPGRLCTSHKRVRCRRVACSENIVNVPRGTLERGSTDLDEPIQLFCNFRQQLGASDTSGSLLVVHGPDLQRSLTNWSIHKVRCSPVLPIPRSPATLTW